MIQNEQGGETMVQFFLGFAVGVVLVAALAHFVPTMFISPEKYFKKIMKKAERKLDRAEEGSKTKIKKMLRELASLIDNIDLI